MDTYTAYFDKEFVRNFWKGDKNLTKDFYNNYMKELAQDSVVYTNYDSIDEMRGTSTDPNMSENQKIGTDGQETFWEILIDTQSKIKLLNNEIEKSMSDSEMQQEWISKCIKSGGCNVFFVEYSEEECQVKSAEFGYLFISTGNFGRIWKSLASYGSRSIVKSLVRAVSPKDDSVFNGWQDLDFIGQVPNNTIIITDRYLLTDTNNQKIDKNLIPLLKAIRPKSFIGELDILILFSRMGLPRNWSDDEVEEHIKNIHKKIKTSFKDYGYKNVNLVFINVIPGYGEVRMHGRYVYTNYFTIWSDPGFNLIMDKGERVKCDSQVEIYFFNSKYNTKRRNILDNLNNLRNLVIQVKENKRLKTFKHYPKHKKWNLRCRLLKLDIT